MCFKVNHYTHKNMPCRPLQTHQKKGRNEHTARGIWSLPESKLDINSLELKAAFFVPKRVPRPVREQYSSHSHRQHHSGCLHKQRRGMKSGPLCALLWRILTWCSRKQVTLKARHIPGQLNVVAVKLSRLGQTIQAEWFLPTEVFQAICNKWHQTQIDCFVTRFNNKLIQFVSRVLDPLA